MISLEHDYITGVVLFGELLNHIMAHSFACPLMVKILVKNGTLLLKLSNFGRVSGVYKIVNMNYVYSYFNTITQTLCPMIGQGGI